MKKLLLAGGAGAAAMYFLDGERGPARRRRLLSAWRDGKGAALEAGHHGAKVVEPLTPVPEQIMNRIDSGTRTTPRVVLTRVAVGASLAGIVAAALGYLLDPVRGGVRRERLRGLWRKAADRARTVGPWADDEIGSEPAPIDATEAGQVTPHIDAIADVPPAPNGRPLVGGGATTGS